MKKKVLIVDDSTFMRMVLKDLLSSQLPELAILEADGEKNALISLKKESPDIVLLDIIMNASEVEGLNLLEAIHTTYPNISVIMITSVGHASIKKQCEELGVKGYIQKPFDAEQIKSEVAKCL